MQALSSDNENSVFYDFLQVKLFLPVYNTPPDLKKKHEKGKEGVLYTRKYGLLRKMCVKYR